MEQVKDDLPYYPQCDSCKHGGNYQPYWNQSEPKENGWYLIAMMVNDKITYAPVYVHDYESFYGYVKMQCLCYDAEYVAWHKIEALTD